MTANRRPNLYAFASLFLVLIIDTMGFGIIMPILPTLFLDSKLGMLSGVASTYMRDFYFGITMGVFFLFTFIGSPFMGDLSDHFGRKKVLLLCLLTVAFGYVISAAGIVSKSLFVLILGRAICGFAAGSQPISQAAIIDVSTDENKTFNIGLITLAAGVGFIIGPIMGGYFSQLLPESLVSYSLPFLIAAGLAIINAISLQFSLKETYVPPHRRHLSILKSLTSFKAAVNIKSLHYLSVAYLFVQLAWSIFFQYTALYLAQTFHYSANKIGFFMSYIGLIFVISLSIIIRPLLTVLTLYSLIASSLYLIVLGIAATFVFRSELGLWLSVLAITVGNALGYAGLTSVFSGRVDKDSQGMVMGLVGSLSSVSWVVGSLSIGFITTHGSTIAFTVIGGLIVMTILLLHFDSKKYHY